jgi:hypothetical protein
MNQINYIPNDIMSLILNARTEQMKNDKYKKDYDKVVKSFKKSVSHFKFYYLEYNGVPLDKYENDYNDLMKIVYDKKSNIKDCDNILDNIELYDFGYYNILMDLDFNLDQYEYRFNSLNEYI